MKKNNEILKVENVSKYFGGIHALESVDITVQEGSIHGIIGPNGSGKTTLFNVITGIYTVTKGKNILLFKGYHKYKTGSDCTYGNQQDFSERYSSSKNNNN